MAIKNIKVKNYKSFKDLDLDLGSFNVVIGANASGKSNLTSIFEFIKNIDRKDLRHAVALSGGFSNLKNFKATEDQSLGLEISFETNITIKSPSNKKILAPEISYKLALQDSGSRQGYTICEDSISHLFMLPDVQRHTVLSISHIGSELCYDMQPIEKEIEWLVPSFANEGKVEFPENTVVLKSPYLPLRPWPYPFEQFATYDIDPNRAKNPSQITGVAELTKNADNLALVLEEILADRESKRKLLNLISYLLPFVDGVDTESLTENSLMVSLHEKFYEHKKLSAFLLSDGTISLIALIVAMYFEEKKIVCFEEPERNIHPHLIAKLVDMMKDASKNKQIIVTTHSPEVVKHAGLENLLLISRDEDGFSTITRPSEKEEVQIFMQNELGLDELYVQNLLGN